MFYKPTQQNELTRAQMDLARKGFRGKLVGLRFSPQFIVNNSDELLAIAHTEYVRAIEKGDEVEDPVGWTIHCAWRRTQNLLQAESYRPRMVSSERVMELADEDALAPDELTLEEDRARKIREAVEKLSEDQRKVIALTFFEGYSVREAASYLHWSTGKVQHHRDTALRHLRRFLPVKTSDELEIDIGLIAWLSIAGAGTTFHLPAGFEGLLDKAGEGASGLWARAHDLARRLTLGGGSDAAGAVASSGAGRAAGVCATGVAIICFASASAGLVGPGVGGGISALGGGDHSPQAKSATKVVPKGEASATTPTTEASAPTQPLASTSGVSSPSSRPSEKDSRAGAKASSQKTESRQVEEQTSGIARAASESSTSSPTGTASSAGGSAETVTVSPAPSGGASSSEAAQAKQQFGAFK